MGFSSGVMSFGFWAPLNIRRLGLVLIKLPNLASDWNTIWEIFL